MFFFQFDLPGKLSTAPSDKTMSPLYSKISPKFEYPGVCYTVVKRYKTFFDILKAAEFRVYLIPSSQGLSAEDPAPANA